MLKRSTGKYIQLILDVLYTVRKNNVAGARILNLHRHSPFNHSVEKTMCVYLKHLTF